MVSESRTPGLLASNTFLSHSCRNSLLEMPIKCSSSLKHISGVFVVMQTVVSANMQALPQSVTAWASARSSLAVSIAVQIWILECMILAVGEGCNQALMSH